MSANDQKAAWFEDESFWIPLYPYMFPNDKFERAEEEAENILKLSDFRGNSILDLCCGPGTHAVTLAKRGFEVTGVDISPHHIEKARERGQAEGVQVEWILDDMRDFVREGAFDLVLSMSNSFGYFDREQDNLRVLRNIHQSLRSGCSFLMDIVSKEFVARFFQPTLSHKYADGAIIVNRQKVTDDWSRIQYEWILIKDGKARIFEFHHTLYSGEELKGILAQAGFQRVTLYGGLDGKNYGVDARSLIAIATKG